MDWSVGYREVPPPPAVRHGVSAFWIRTMPPEPGPPADVWPDAGVDIIWQQGDGPLLAGADTGPMPATLEPGAVLAGVRLRPGAAGPVLRLPMYELRDRRVLLSEVAPRLARSLPGHLPPEVAFRRLYQMTARLLAEGGPDPVVGGGAEHLRDPGNSLDDLLLQTSLSGRQLRRRFRHALGYGPKTLQRVLRFQRVVALLGSGADLAMAAALAGYADQAHMTRECRRLSGKTPRDLAQTVVAESFKTAAG